MGLPVSTKTAQLAMALFLSGGLFSCTTVLTSTQVTDQNTAIPPEQGLWTKSAGYYWLPRGKFRLIVKRDKSGDPCTAELKETVFEPDPHYLFRLDFSRSITSTDKLNIEVGENGLLKTITVETDERSVAIAQKLVDIAKESAKAAVSLGTLGTNMLGTKTVTRDQEPFSIDILLLPPDSKEEREFLDDVNLFLSERTCPEVQIDPPSFVPATIMATLGSSIEGQLMGSRGEGHGLFFRPLMPYDFKFVSPDGFVLLRKSFYLPNASPILFHELSRAFFVKNTATLQFQNGLLTTVNSQTPSSLEGFMDIPLSIVKAAASLPAELVQLKIDLTQKDTALRNAQKDQIEAQKNTIGATKELIETEEALRKAKEDLAKKSKE